MCHPETLWTELVVLATPLGRLVQRAGNDRRARAFSLHLDYPMSQLPYTLLFPQCGTCSYASGLLQTKLCAFGPHLEQAIGRKSGVVLCNGQSQVLLTLVHSGRSLSLTHKRQKKEDSETKQPRDSNRRLAVRPCSLKLLVIGYTTKTWPPDCHVFHAYCVPAMFSRFPW